MGPKNGLECFVETLLCKQFSPSSLAYENISVFAPGFGSTTPDFDVYSSVNTLLIEVTASKFENGKDPKINQRRILEQAVPEMHQHAFAILYLQHCVSEAGIMVAKECLASLTTCEDSKYVQAELDDFAARNRECTPIHMVNWVNLCEEVFGYIPNNIRRFK